MTSPSPCPDDLALEHDHLRWTQFCFSSGEPIQQEGDAARSGSTGKLPDELVGGRLETRRDGGICADLGAFRLVRSAAMAFAGPLDLVADPPRQNGSISGDHARLMNFPATQVDWRPLTVSGYLPSAAGDGSMSRRSLSGSS